MISFSLIAALMLLGALLLVLTPLIRKPKSNKLEQKQINLDIYKQRLAELDHDLAEGLVDQAEYAAAEQDLEKQLIVDIPENEQTQNLNDQRSQPSLIAMLIIIPAATIGLYFYLGSPQVIDAKPAQQANASHQQTAGMDQAEQPSVEEMIVKLEERLKEHPEDAKGWYLLSRSYMHVQQFEKAEQALEKLTQLVKDDPSVWANYADIAAVNQKGKLDGRPYEYTKRALALEPKHPKALWLAGTYHFQQQEYDKAVRFWTILQKELPADSKGIEMINASLADARKRAGMEPTDTQATQQKPIASSGMTAAISGRVSVIDALKDKLSPEDTVFVYARATSGPRMPLAIVKKQVKDLPFDFKLDDSMAMMPQMKLSNFEKVVVSARISKSGNAMTQSGDLISNQPEVTIKDKQALNLEIQQQVP